MYNVPFKEYAKVLIGLYIQNKDMEGVLRLLNGKQLSIYQENDVREVLETEFPDLYRELIKLELLK